MTDKPPPADWETWATERAPWSEALDRLAELLVSEAYADAQAGVAEVAGANPPTSVAIELMGLQAEAIQGLGELDRAEALLREALSRARDSLGPGHPITRQSASDLADFLSDQGRDDEATAVVKEAGGARSDRASQSAISAILGPKTEP